MKTLLLVILFTISIAAQPLKMGLHLPVYLTGKDISAGTGLNLSLQYDLPGNYSVKTLAGFEPPFCNMNNLLNRYLYGVTYGEISFQYSIPIENTYPFIELGAGYYSHSTNQSSGNLGTIDGDFFSLKEIKNNIGYNLGIGVEFQKSSCFHFIASVKGTYIKTDYTLTMFGKTGKSYEKEDTINLSSIKLSLGFIFNL